MTPKEKAEELFIKFMLVTPLYAEEVKKYALIAVDEIINSEPQKPLFKTTIDVHGVKEDIHDYPPDLFWQEVKEEIIRL